MLHAMSINSTISRPPNAARRAMATDRSGEYRDRLLAAGKELLVEQELARVSVEQLLERAGVSRATFYGLFANKNELAEALLMPVFESGTDALRSLRAKAPERVAEGLIDAYLTLWRDQENALLLTSSLNDSFSPAIRERHDEFVAILLDVLRIIDSAGLLRTHSAELTAEVLARTAIPLLRVYAGRDDMAELYRGSMRGLILGSTY